MERFQELREAAAKKLSVAEHLLTVTYPMVKDPKILLAVMENLYEALENGMDSLLQHDLQFKKIEVVPQDFNTRYTLFKEDVAKRHNIENKQAKLIGLARDVLHSHKESPVEFAHKEKFVICTDEYKTRTLTPETVKEQVMQAKDFLQKVRAAENNNERIFR